MMQKPFDSNERIWSNSDDEEERATSLSPTFVLDSLNQELWNESLGDGIAEEEEASRIDDEKGEGKGGDLEATRHEKHLLRGSRVDEKDEGKRSDLEGDGRNETHRIEVMADASRTDDDEEGETVCRLNGDAEEAGRLDDEEKEE
jgi:hypothetical protein